MNRFFCSLLVPVAFLATAGSAMASPQSHRVSGGLAADRASFDGTAADNSLGYWSASSEYMVRSSPLERTSGAPERRVKISGYHPLEGFEAELEAEAQAAGRHQEDSDRG